MADNSLASRIKRSWNAFFNSRDPTRDRYQYGYGTYFRPDRIRLNYGNERSIVTAIYNRISMDVAAVNIKHVKIDQNGRYKETKDSRLNTCLTLSANKDQTSRMFIQDLVLSMLDEGVVAAVPTTIFSDSNTYENSDATGFDIQSLRVGKIIEWYPDKVKCRVYNEDTGKKQDLILSKSMVAIIEDPFYAVMNEPNSTFKRLVRKLALLDMTDEQNSSGKLDLIIQLPYTIKSEARKKQAEERREDIEMQLAGSRGKYGIAYTDSTEKVTQLNRSVENQLLSQVQYLQNMLYSQLGITEEVLNGKADEQTTLNYMNHVVEPILSAITDEFKRKFLTKTARTQGQSIMFFRDPFKLVPINSIADIADKFTRNEILSSNEVRGLIGFLPVDDERADELRNKNINQSADQQFGPIADPEDEEGGEENQYYDEQ